MPDLLYPFTSTIAAALAGTHSLAEALGLPSGSAAAWLLALALLVVAVRGALLPLVLRSVRTTHARARATPQLTALTRRYEGRRDLESLQALQRERRDVHAEHGISRWSLAPALLQLPLVYALYRVVSDLAAGHAVGLLDAGLVASAGAASVAGLTVTARLGDAFARDWRSGAVLLGLALLAGALSFATSRWFTLPLTDLSAGPALAANVSALMPWLGLVGILAAAAFVPAGVLVYWVVNNAWTFAQQGLVWRLAPTPGSPAAIRRLEG
jgi:YidC/Oxa1 family membrane protein insertase